MPTDLPPRRIERPKSSAQGTLVFTVAILLMLAISAALLLHPEGVDATAAPPSASTAL